MIQVEGLTKFYRDITAIEDLSFSVEKGEIVGFLGPNGAGKSTTMRILTGYLPASRGKALIGGIDVFENPIATKRKVGYLPEIPPVYGDLVVRDYLRFVASLKGVRGPKVASEVGRVAELAGVARVQHRLIRNLSKGYQQRVGLAQSLLADPEVLILDEPTVGLDPIQIAEVRDVIRRLADRHTIILSTHILPEVEMTCKRAIVISKGRIVAEDTIENLIASANRVKRIHVATRKGGPELADRLRRIGNARDVRATLNEAEQRLARQSIAFLKEANEPHSEFIVEGEFTLADRAAISQTIVDGGFDLISLTDISARLEDVFREVVTHEHGVASANSDAANQPANDSTEGAANAA